MIWLDRFLMWLPCFASHVIRKADGSPYLLRKYLLPRRFSGAWWPGVFLHRFYQSDTDRCPHSHPWRFAVSLILTGGYQELRFHPRHFHDYVTGDTGGFSAAFSYFTLHIRLPWSLNVIRATDYHKAELLEPERGCWTLFVAFGHKRAKAGEEWGFIDPDTGVVTGWRDYLPAGADGLEGD